MYSSVNCLSKSEFCRLVSAGVPVVLYSPVMPMPGVNGLERVEGPWPGTPVPVEEIPDTKHHNRPKQRERIRPWHAEVRVQDMRVVEVVA